MLALTHHVIVQVAAHRVGYPGSWFGNYALLGDDIVIGDKRVADAYLVLMTDLGVSINMSKSVISTQGSLEFAKRIIISGKDLSPYGPKALTEAINAPRQSLDLVISILEQEGLTTEIGIKSLFSIDQLDG
jgi:hypothetical protein